MNVPTCSGLGSNAFVGGHNANVAGATDSGVLSGYSNQSCDTAGAIGAGGQNAISSASHTATDSFIGAGTANTITNSGKMSFIGAGSNNLVEQQAAAIGAGTQNANNGSYSVIGGGTLNSIGVGTEVADGYDMIGSGASNAIRASFSVIGGGQSNAIFANDAFIGGGSSNIIGADGTTEGADGVIGGGQSNTVLGQNAVVGGGYKNQANGLYSTVPGGAGNIAASTGSFAAGLNSWAANDGTFVWSDDASGATQLKSTGVNQFLARASGGFTFYTNSVNSSGAVLAGGSGTWASLSDRNVKTDISAVDADQVLEKIATLPISRWSYVSEGHVRHIGPMAQDFYRAFGLGPDEKHVTTIDEEGVAYAAIQALQTRLQDANRLAQRAHVLRQTHRRDEMTLAALQRRAATLESQLRDLTVKNARMRSTAR